MGEECDDYIDLSVSAVRKATVLTAKMLGISLFMYTRPESKS